MSAIDRYRHECIGWVRCPSSYWPRPSAQELPLFILHEDALDADDFQAKKGDLLLGGGSGEASAFWISMPEALIFFTCDNDEELFPSELYQTIVDIHDSVYHAFWSPTDAYLFCEGYTKVGWHPLDKPFIEVWLTQHILAFVLREYPDLWGHLRGPEPLDEDGSICRLPTEAERAIG